MRFSPPLLIASLLSALLTACAAAPGAPAKSVVQSGPLKVHPGLLGQAAAAEPQAPAEPQKAEAKAD